MNAAALHAVTKRFGDAVVLDAVDLSVRPGEVLAVLGPNGAGKTTALSILLGLRRPDRGRAELFGRDPREADVRGQIGVTPQETGFPPTLRVGEIVRLVRAHFDDPPPAGVLLERFGLTRLTDRQAGGLSGGERRRLSVALAFAGRPRAVFLDEATAGLDTEARHSVWREIEAFAGQGGTVLLTTHHLEEAERLASRVIVLSRGAVVANGTPVEVAGRAHGAGLEKAFLALTEAAP